MAHVQLAAQERTELGSAATRRLRRQGLVPGVLYQSGAPSVPFSVSDRDLRRVLYAEGGRTSVIDVRIGSAPPKPALMKDHQLHPVRDSLMHIDLMQVDLTELAEQPVPLVLTGNPVGVRDGGVLDQPVREVVVSALPDDLPDSIEADVTGLEVGGTLHLSDLSAPEGVRILGDPELVIASVTTPSAVIEEPTEEAEAVEGAADVEREAGGPAEGGDAES